MRHAVFTPAMKLADERLQFVDPDADLPGLLPVPLGMRPAAQLPLHTHVRNAAQRHAAKLCAVIGKDIAREEARGTPFFFAPVFMAFGSVLYFTAASEPSMMALLALAFLLFAFLRFRQSGGHKVWLSSALCLIALGAVFAKAETFRATSSMLGGEISTQTELRIRRLEHGDKSVRITADVLTTARPTLKYAPSRVRVTLRNAPPDLKAGDIISARFGLQPPSGPVRPGGYDFAFHAWFQGIGATGFSMGKIVKLQNRPAPWRDRMVFALENARMDIAQKVRAVIPGSDGAMAAALIAGVSGGIDEDTNEALRVTGLAHVISISGLHMALVAGVFIVTIRLGFALFPAFASRLPVKKYGAAAALAASFFYLLLSGAGVATVRSFIMLAVMLAAVLLDRQALTLRNLAIAAILILMVTPHEIMGPSFQMSFAATAALISAYSWMAQRRQQQQQRPQTQPYWERAKRLVTGALLTPLVAGLATALFSAWHFHRLAPMGLPANLAAMPVVSIIVMPAAVVSALAMPLGVEHWPLKIMGEGVHLMLDIARYFAGLSPAGMSGAVARPAFLTAVIALLLLCLLQTRLRLAGIALLPVLALLLARPQMPDLLVSEDARLVAYVDQNQLAVNRTRPNGFTTQTWQRAAKADRLVKPDVVAVAPGYNALSRRARSGSGTFHCQPGLCLLTTQSGFEVAWLEQLPDTPDNAGSGVVSPPGANALSLAQGIPNGGRLVHTAGAKADHGTNQTLRHIKSPVPASRELVGAVDGGASNLHEDQTSGQTANADFPEPRQTSESGRAPGHLPTKAGKQFDFAPAYLRLLRQACAKADLVVAASPTPFRNCPTGKARLLRASELARKGTAEIEFISQNNRLQASAETSLHQTVAENEAIRQPWRSRQHGNEPDSQLPMHATAAPNEDLTVNAAVLANAPANAAESSSTAVVAKADAAEQAETPANDANANDGAYTQLAAPVNIRFAIGEPVRPWNRERVFSRAARNMPEFVPIRRTAPRLNAATRNAGTRRGPQ